ncbi:uncharacterized protein BXZ73DRAFT_83240 [Epithele typhae]|uniref:uncharacterized protein n=1 Tax=Epithele typhae TaxID=378194 RepID=UPI00200873DE|nr:uncharacterized protein BXZ73DRAFT_83240 [Epithele typhae]KAH9910729.1 hypothetical protein BXZ73DRAFT_83240 [Epithele typhae]
MYRWQGYSGATQWLRNCTIAFLSCTNSFFGPVGLFIKPCPFTTDRAHPLFHTSFTIPFDTPRRLLALTKEDFLPIGLSGLPSESKGWEWANILLAHPVPPHTEAPRRALTQMNASLATPFRVPEASLHACVAEGVRLTSFCKSGDVVGLQFMYGDASLPLEVIVRLGLCLRGSDRRETGMSDLTTFAARPSASTCHWATMHFPDNGDFRFGESLKCILEKWNKRHECGEDHVRNWTDRRKLFSGRWGLQKVVISFTVCPMNGTGNTLELHISRK